jgi:hypothetical protein
MSTFGDHTPKQDILDNLESIRSDHQLTTIELIKAVLEVITYLLEYSH